MPRRARLLATLVLAALLPGCLDAAAVAWDDARVSAGLPPVEVTAKSAFAEAEELSLIHISEPTRPY